MSTVTSLELGRYKRLPLRAADVWQGAAVRLPMWLQERASDPPRRVRGVVWVSVRTGLMWIELAEEPDDDDVDVALRGLIHFAKKFERDLMGRASRLEVIGESLAAGLTAALGDRDTRIAAVGELPNVRDVVRALERHETEELAMPPALLESPGVTLEGLRGFAAAAARFYAANVWNAFDSQRDLFVVEAPVVDQAMNHLVVTGRLGPEYRGLMFFPTPALFHVFHTDPDAARRRMPVTWMISFDPIDKLPFGDADAWIDHVTLALPNVLDAVAGRAAQDGIHASGDPSMLSMRLQLENAMRHVHRAMVMSGATSPDDVQRIFEDAVDTVSSASETAPASPLEQAQALAYEAMEASGRNQIRLARQALAISRDCADVWRVLASREPYPDGAIPLLREAVAAGARALEDRPH